MRRLLQFIFCFTTIKLCGQEPKLVLPIGHTDKVHTAQYSPDGRNVLTASSDKSVKLWDVRTGALLLDLLNENGGYTQLSPDGSQILTIGTGCEIFETKTGNRIKSFSGNNYAYGILLFNSCNFSKDGKKIVTTSNNNNAEIWEVESERLLAILTGHSNEVPYAEFSPDGKRVVTASWDSTAKLWDAKTGEILFTFKHPYFVTLAKFSPDGKKIATISTDSIARLWDVNTGQLITELVGHDYSIYDIAFDAESNRIVTASSDWTAKVWDGTTGKFLLNLTGHLDRVTKACFNSDGKSILTASDDGGAILWNALTGKQILQIYNHQLPVISASFSPDGKRILTSSDDHTAKIWDPASQKLIMDFTGRSMTPHQSTVSPEGTKILTGYNDGIARILDYNTGKLSLSLQGHKEGISSVEYSPDGKKIITASWDSTSKIWDAVSGKLLFTLKGFKGSVYSASFSWDGKKIITASEDSAIKLWDATSGKLLATKRQKNDVFGARFFPDGKKVISFGGRWKDSTKIWDISKGSFHPNVMQDLLEKITAESKRDIKFSADGKKMMIICNPATLIIDLATMTSIKMENSFDATDASFSPDGSKTIITGLFNTRSDLVNSITGKRYYKYYNSNRDDHQDRINSACFSNDGTKIITASRDNTVKIWNADDGDCIYTYIVTEGTDYIIKEPSGYYYSTVKASKQLYYVTQNLQVITFEQLDVKYNRPDKVLEAFGSTDTALIRSYRKAWEKRIKKLGVDTTAFRDGYSVPECDFINRNAIEYEQKNETLTLHIKGTDSTYKLDRFNVWVNESPLFGQRGISIRRKNSNSIDTTITIKLSQGENRIETSITNVNGTESYRMPLLVNYIPEKPERELAYFIGLGISRFSDSKYDLQYSVKDIRDLAAKLKEKYGDDIIIDTLFDENVTAEKVNALKQKLQKTSVNDKVIVSYSGHGLLSKDFDYYLSTYPINFEKPEENGLPYDELENLLDSIPARKKLMLIDACHSGEVDKDDLITLNGITDSSIKRGIKPIAYKKDGQLGLKNSFELMQSLFVNVGKSTGATIISAAAGTQFALERSDLKNGVFTYSILEAMKNYPQMKISELKTIVGKRVEELTNGLQKPTSRNETIAVDWNVW